MTALEVMQSVNSVATEINGQDYIRALCVFNNKVYGGTASGGRLFEWNGIDAWTRADKLIKNYEQYCEEIGIE